MNPRNYFDEATIETHRITRQSVTFGPQVKKDEKMAKRTRHGWGLLFACYQSSITNGFQFLQKNWANNPDFVAEGTGWSVSISSSHKIVSTLHRPDPIIGQGTDLRPVSGLESIRPNNPDAQVVRPGSFVIPYDGEYFFSLSLSGLKHIAAPSIRFLSQISSSARMANYRVNYCSE
ncbi:hypothetical protein BD779DRAFT_1674735 [Infundibulicybe gibba]|nr:hypothetical protein BD779DRAFT_1674735 [Infundibulicybe gibba]